MKISSIVARRRVAGISAGCLLGGMAMGIVGAPSAAAAPDCSPAGVNST
ncbi:MAG: heme-binding protein, partial [Mycobacterium sp.]